MILISHRGNLEGKQPEQENNPLYIYNALNKGYEVEIDVWYKDNEFYLGHDEPTYHINLNWLRNKKFWCHAKNIEALNKMLKQDIHCFWHQEDYVTLTNKGHIWCFPGHEIDGGIMVDHGQGVPEGINILGICTDEPMIWRD
jgi:hypothetical protein